MTASYATTPACKMVATHCICCGLPLLDAQSLARGVGPDCWTKHGFKAADKAMTEAARSEANKIIFNLAAEPATVATPERLARLTALGLEKAVARIEKRLVKIDVVKTAAGISLFTPYSDEEVERLRRIPGRRWNQAEKCNTYPLTSATDIWVHLQKHHGGVLARGPKGLFIIGAPLAPAAKPAPAVVVPAAPVKPVPAAADARVIAHNKAIDAAKPAASVWTKVATAAGAEPTCGGCEHCDGENLCRTCSKCGLFPDNCECAAHAAEAEADRQDSRRVADAKHARDLAANPEPARPAFVIIPETTHPAEAGTISLKDRLAQLRK